MFAVALSFRYISKSKERIMVDLYIDSRADAFLAPPAAKDYVREGGTLLDTSMG